MAPSSGGEFYLLLMVLGMLSLLGLAWAPLLLAVPLALGALSVVGAIAVAGAGRSDVALKGDSLPRRATLRSVTALLHVIQPLARPAGVLRLRGGLSPWRRRAEPVVVFPRARHVLLWSERWYSVDQWLTRVETGLRKTSHAVVRGSDFDRWDLEVRGGAPAALAMALVDCAAAAGTMARAVQGSLPEAEHGASQPSAALRPAFERSTRGEHALVAASEGSATAMADERCEANR